MLTRLSLGLIESVSKDYAAITAVWFVDQRGIDAGEVFRGLPWSGEGFPGDLDSLPSLSSLAGSQDRKTRPRHTRNFRGLSGPHGTGRTLLNHLLSNAKRPRTMRPEPMDHRVTCITQFNDAALVCGYHLQSNNEKLIRRSNFHLS
jgi:hypothetical protein